MKVYIVSDLHLEHHAAELPAALDIDVAILAGDIDSPGIRAPRLIRGRGGIPSKRIVWVAGNHEYYGREMSEEAKLMRAAARSYDIDFLDCDSVVINGLRILGCTLWTDFRLPIAMPGLPGEPEMLVSDRERGMRESGRYVADYSMIRILRDPQSLRTGASSLHPLDTMKIHRRQRRWLFNELSKPFAGPTIVVTHHAPHRNSLAPKYACEWSSTAFVSELPPEFFKVPVLWVHGHTHTSFDYRVGNCRVICNPRGYMNWHGDFDGSGFNPGLVVEVPT